MEAQLTSSLSKMFLPNKKYRIKVVVVIREKLGKLPKVKCFGSFKKGGFHRAAFPQEILRGGTQSCEDAPQNKNDSPSANILPPHLKRRGRHRQRHDRQPS